MPDNKKYVVGAFTVANLNDTDGDGTIDKDDRDVTGEKDRMKLPIGGYKGLAGKVKLTIKSGSVRLWETKEKETEVPLINGAVFSNIPADGMNTDLWIEATAVSRAVRDIEIWEGYQETSGSLTDGADKVKATAVWASSPKDPWRAFLWLEAQGPAYGERAGKTNEVELGSMPIRNAPTP